MIITSGVEDKKGPPVVYQNGNRWSGQCSTISRAHLAERSVSTRGSIATRDTILMVIVGAGADKGSPGPSPTQDPENAWTIVGMCRSAKSGLYDTSKGSGIIGAQLPLD